VNIIFPEIAPTPQPGQAPRNPTLDPPQSPVHLEFCELIFLVNASWTGIPIVLKFLSETWLTQFLATLDFGCAILLMHASKNSNARSP
jgi:hypothetical protein